MLMDTYAAIRHEIQQRNTLETKPEHWIDDYDGGLSYCRDCALTKIAELQSEHSGTDYELDGGWRTEGDSLAFCESCNCPLDNGLTDYGVQQELEHFEAEGFKVDSAADWRSLDELVEAAIYDESPYHERMSALCAAVMAAIDGN